MNERKTPLRKNNKKNISFILCLIFCFMLLAFNAWAYSYPEPAPGIKPDMVVTPESFSEELAKLNVLNTDTIKLTSDVTADRVSNIILGVVGDKTIDLNGYTLKTDIPLYVFELGSLTITDSKGGGRFDGTIEVMEGGLCTLDMSGEGSESSYINTIFNYGKVEFTNRTRCDVNMLWTFDKGYTHINGETSIYFSRLMSDEAKLAIEGHCSIQLFMLYKDYFNNVSIRARGTVVMGTFSFPKSYFEFSLYEKHYERFFIKAWSGDYQLDGTLSVIPDKAIASQTETAQITAPTVAFNSAGDLRVGVPITVTAVVSDAPENAVYKWECPESGFFIKDEVKNGLSYTFTPTEARSYTPILFITSGGKTERYVHKITVVGNTPPEALLSVSPSELTVGKPVTVTAVLNPFSVCENIFWDSQEVSYYATDEKKTVTEYTFTPTKAMEYCVTFFYDFEGENYRADIIIAVSPAVEKAPVITKQPLPKEAEVGDKLTFSLTAENAVKYNWFICDEEEGQPYSWDSVKLHAQVSGENTDEVTIKPKDTWLDGKYISCDVFGEKKWLASDYVMITVNKSSYKMPFTDVKEGEWYYDSIKGANKMGLINGVAATTYEPESNITFSQAVKLAACMHELYTNGSVTLQNGEENWYDTYYEYCVENEIINPVYSYSYALQAEENISRKYFAYLFSRALPENSLPRINNIPDDALPDVKNDGSVMNEAVYFLYHAGIVTGSDNMGTFNPETSIQRSEVAAILIRMMDPSERKETPALVNGK